MPSASQQEFCAALTPTAVWADLCQTVEGIAHGGAWERVWDYDYRASALGEGQR